MSEIDYLQAMGIQRWQRRKGSVAQVLSTSPEVALSETEPVVISQNEQQSEAGLKADIQQNSAALASEESQSVNELESTEISPTESQETESISDQPHKAEVVIDSVEQTITLEEANTDNALEFPYQGYQWEQLLSGMTDGTICQSCQQSGFVFGDGQLAPDWLFISDAPNADELKQQSLFSGRAGQLFEAMLCALNLQRDTVYTTSLFKCPPNQSGDILTANCAQILQQQVALLKPKVIVTLGEFAAQSVLSSNDSLSVLSGKQHNYCGVPVYALLHPRQILQEPSSKAAVWRDLKLACQHTL